LLQHVVFWMYPFRLLADRDASWSRKRNCILSLLVTFGSLAVCLNVLSNIVDVMGMWLSLVLYLAMVELVNFPHHLDTHLFEDDPEGTKLAVWDQPSTTRSCYYPFPLSEVLFLNFNFHTEHHVFPRAPWWHLRVLRRSLRARSSVYHECVAVGWNIRNRCRPLSEVAIPARS
jgi:omega-6 fatty acid desaturase (delta-12 desaturase)